MLKRLSVIAAMVAFSAAPAFATLVPITSGMRQNLVEGVDYTITATAIEEVEPHGGSSGAAGDIYNSHSGGYQAFPAATGSLGFDDYTSTRTPASGHSSLDAFGFVGGCAAAGRTLFVDFYTGTPSAPVFDTGFSINLTNGGNFLYTITFNPPLNTAIFPVPNQGLVELTGSDGTDGGNLCSGQWFLTPNAVTVGSSDINTGGAPGTHNHAMRMSIPEPTSLALLAIGGLFVARRRRLA